MAYIGTNPTFSGTMDAGTGIIVGTFTAGVVQSDATGDFSSSTGTDGQVLIGGGAAPAWASITAGTNITLTPGPNTLTIDATGGASSINITPVNTTPYVVLATDNFLAVDCSGGAIIVQLPNAPTTGRVFTVKDTTGSATPGNQIIITTVGGIVNIDGAATYPLQTAYQSVQLVFDGTGYEIY